MQETDEIAAAKKKLQAVSQSDTRRTQARSQTKTGLPRQSLSDFLSFSAQQERLRIEGSYAADNGNR